MEAAVEPAAVERNWRREKLLETLIGTSRKDIEIAF